MCMIVEKSVIDVIIDSGTQTAGDLDYRVLHSELSPIEIKQLCINIDLLIPKNWLVQSLP